MEKNSYYVNSIVRVNTKGNVRSFVFEGDAVCENRKNTCTELLSTLDYTLVDSLQSVPEEIQNGFIALKGKNHLDYRMDYKKESDEILKNFDYFFSKSLKKLETENDDKISTTSKSIYQMLSFKSAYLRSKFSDRSYLLD